MTVRDDTTGHDSPYSSEGGDAASIGALAATVQPGVTEVRDGIPVNVGTAGGPVAAFGLPDAPHASLVITDRGQLAFSYDGDEDPFTTNHRVIFPDETSGGAKAFGVVGPLICYDGLVLVSPGGTVYRLTVADGGTLSTVVLP